MDKQSTDELESRMRKWNSAQFGFIKNCGFTKQEVKESFAKVVDSVANWEGA